MSGWREAFGSVSLHAGGDTDVRCSTYDDRTPLLSLGSPRLNVTVAIAGLAVSAEALAFARELATQAAAFAAECERLHAAQQPPSAAVPGQGSAGERAM